MSDITKSSDTFLYSGLGFSVVTHAILFAKIFWWDRKPAQKTVPLIQDGQSEELTADMVEDEAPKGFRIFQVCFLIMFLMATCSDWLISGVIYDVFLSVGEESGWTPNYFFAMQGLAQGLAVLVVHPVALFIGRRSIPMVSAALYGLSNVLLLWHPHVSLALLSRFSFGIAQTVVYNDLDALMVAEHMAAGFSPGLLGKTYHAMTFFNSLNGIGSSWVADQLKTQFNNNIMVPVYVSIGLCFLTCITSPLWIKLGFPKKSPFNTTETDDNHNELNQMSLFDSIAYVWKSFLANKLLFCLLGYQTFFEVGLGFFWTTWNPTVAELQYSTTSFMTALMAFQSGASVLGSFLQSPPPPNENSQNELEQNVNTEKKETGSMLPVVLNIIVVTMAAVCFFVMALANTNAPYAFLVPLCIFIILFGSHLSVFPVIRANETPQIARPTFTALYSCTGPILSATLLFIFDKDTIADNQVKHYMSTVGMALCALALLPILAEHYKRIQMNDNVDVQIA